MRSQSVTHLPLTILVVLLFAGLTLTLPLLATAQPAEAPTFAQLWGDASFGGGITLTLAGPTMQHTPIAAGMSKTGIADPAITTMPDGALLAMWGRTYCIADCKLGVNDLRYRLVSSTGTPQETAHLTDHSTTTVSTYDREPVIAVTPNGAVGVLWRRFQFTDTTTSAVSPLDADRAEASASIAADNLYFATLTANGKPHAPPTPLTDYALSENAPSHDMARIAVTSDDRFVITWEERISETSTLHYRVQNIAGTTVVTPTALYSETVAGRDFGGVDLLARGEHVLVGVLSSDDGMLQVTTIDSAGTVITPTQPISDVVGSELNLVQLTTGDILAGWTAYNEATNRVQVHYAILDEALSVTAGPTFVEPYDAENAERISVVPQEDGVVLTWMASSGEQLFYAAIDSAGTQMIPTTPFETLHTRFAVSTNGYGATRWQSPFTHHVYLPTVQ